MGIRPSRAVFAAALLGLGILGLICGNSAELWEPIPRGLPARAAIIYFISLLELATGTGLLLRAYLVPACRVLLGFLLLWLLLLKLPALIHAPRVMVSWESFGETAVLTAGGWCLFAAHAGGWERRHLGFAVGEPGIRVARLLFIAALPMFGLAHFAYPALTASLVPKWLGFPLGWTWLTGAASLAAAAGMLCGVWPRLAAGLEAAMLWVFTLLVWVPRIAPLPADQDIWTELLISAAIAGGAWLVADTYRSVAWLASGKASRAIALD